MERLPGLAEELVRLQPDIILAPATTPALVAKQATLTIPIVCPLLENPVGLGLVASHNRPGGNVTGLLRYVDGLAGKTLMLATQLLPGASRIGMLVNVGSAESIDQRRDMTAAAQKLPLKIVPAEVRKPDDLEAAFATLAGERADAVVVLQDSLLFSEHRRILALAAAAVLVITDLTTGTGRFNLVRGSIGTVIAVAASVSTTATGFIFQMFGHWEGFLSLAAVALIAAAFLWVAMPETRPGKYLD
jgi:ABC-type uncharacterized transport system substrate-binding protein